MNPTDPESTIRSRVSVTRQKVLIAKAIVFNEATTLVTYDDLLNHVFRANAVVVPLPVVLHKSVDTNASLTAIADSISWRLATTEAIWSLVHSGLLIAFGDTQTKTAIVPWTTIVPGSGGHSSSWQFEEYSLPVPGRVRRSPSSLGEPNQFLSEPDLYLHAMDVPSMDVEVTNAFAESVKCFRNELFTASLAMLGKASEGAWLELGASLIALVPSGEESKYAKQRSILEDPMMGTYRKIEAVLKMFDHQELFGQVSKSSGVRLQELRSVAVWSDAVRDSRNTIHFGVAPATPNTYEKLAALLLGAVTNVRILYRVKDSADTIPRGT
ncbi:MAG: hypothetical protein MRJ67_16280 [Nitrospirales bacterium]|nr:hypothetical protein [Nitrospirales bacterium]